MFSNIDDHSYFNKAFISIQEYTQEKLVDINVIDDGISIPNSLKENSSYEDNYYIEKALQGMSSKKENIRGFGLRTVYNYITSVPKGEILIASHNGLFYKNNNFCSRLTKYGFIDGTFISLRFDVDKLNNLYSYLE